MRHRFRLRQPSHPHAENEDHQFSLMDLPVGRSGIVSHLDGDREILNRMVNLGFTIGALVTVLNSQGQGPIVVSILGAHFALGRREADLIQVQPV